MPFGDECIEYKPDDFKVYSLLDGDRFLAYVVGSEQSCWKCGKRTSVISLYVGNPPPEDTPHEREFWSDYIKEYKEEMHQLGGFPPDVAGMSYLDDEDCLMEKEQLERILKKFPFWFKDLSKTVEAKYYMNHCTSCGAKQGDFYIHHEVDSRALYFNEWYREMVAEKKVDPKGFEKI